MQKNTVLSASNICVNNGPPHNSQSDTAIHESKQEFNEQKSNFTAARQLQHDKDGQQQEQKTEAKLETKQKNQNEKQKKKKTKKK